MRNKYLTTHEAAKALDLNPQTVQRWCKRGILPAYKVGETRAGWRINETEIEKIWNKKKKTELISE